MPKTVDRRAEVWLALTQTHRPASQLAKDISLSPAWVSKVRRGLLFADLYPELPREPNGRRLSPQQVEVLVVEVLTSGIPVPELAARHHTTTSTIHRIANGSMYPSVRPDIPRRGLLRDLTPRAIPRKRAVTCLDCRLFGDTRCSLELPDAQTINAASRCPAFYPIHDQEAA